MTDSKKYVLSCPWMKFNNNSLYVMASPKDRQSQGGLSGAVSKIKLNHEILCFWSMCWKIKFMSFMDFIEPVCHVQLIPVRMNLINFGDPSLMFWGVCNRRSFRKTLLGQRCYRIKHKWFHLFVEFMWTYVWAQSHSCVIERACTRELLGILCLYKRPSQYSKSKFGCFLSV